MWQKSWLCPWCYCSHLNLYGVVFLIKGWGGGGGWGGGWLYRTSIFWEGLLGKRGWPSFRRGCNFCVKNKSFSQSASSQTLDWVPNMPHSESKLKCYSAKFKDAKIASYSFHSLYHSYFLVHSQKYFKFFKKYH